MKLSSLACALLTTVVLTGSAAAEIDVLHLQTSAPATSATTQADAPPRTESTAGFVEFMAQRFSAHEPVYFLYWPDTPNIKFQFSVKYKLFGLEDLKTPWPADTSGLYVAYTQTSLWDVSAESSPFYDHSYKPEILYQYGQDDPHWIGGMSRFDLQAAVQHEYNGEGKPDSRSMNIAYIRPIFTFGDPGKQKPRGKGYFVTVAPRLWVYLRKGDENQDIEDYRGYGDLRIVVGRREGFQLSATGRVGDDWNHGALELNASYPIQIGKSPNMYLYAQYFLGYGEALIDYNESGSSFRVGIALVR